MERRGGLNTMKQLTFIVLLIAQACGCSPKALSAPEDVRAPASVAACTATENPFECVRRRCEEGGARFNSDKNVCECPRGFLLNTVGPWQCELMHIVPSDGGGAGVIKARASGRDYEFYVSGPARGQVFDTVEGMAGEIALIPAWNMGAQSLDLHVNSEALRALNINPQSLRKIAGPGVALNDFIRQPPLNLPLNANGGLSDAVGGTPYARTVFLPRQTPVRTGRVDLDDVLDRSLARVAAPGGSEVITSFAEAGCADQCLGRTVLLDEPRFQSYRVRMYFSGVAVQDQISIFDKDARVTALTVALVNGAPSGFVLDEDGDVYLHGNEDTLEASRIGLLQKRPARSEIKSFTLDPNEVPVALFEAAQNPALIPAIPRGPHTDTHVWGWFPREAQLPFFKNYLDVPTLYGEEELEFGAVESRHGITVSYLATDGFKHPAIPFAASDLMAGHFNRALEAYRQTRPNVGLVASLSEVFSLAPEFCARSPLGRAVSESRDVLWVLSAGNSGQELRFDARACPQSVRGPHILRMAATAGGDRLAGPSSYGTWTVELAENGCPAQQETCSDQEAVTSFAAPRAARHLADLRSEFQTLSTEDIAFAVMATARVPFNYWGSQPLATISGGRLDAEAARHLLAEQAHWPRGRDLTSSEWQELLLQAKFEQYGDIGNARRRRLVLSEAETFMKRGGLK